VLTRTCTGKGSRHARVSGHDRISTFSTTVGDEVGAIVGASEGAPCNAKVVPPPQSQHASNADVPSVVEA
jgi:hypothetical protein